VPQIAVPDQLRSAISGPDRYDPDINPTYADLAQHYNIAIVPARPAKPRDKAKVETAVLVAQRWILARMRNRTFFSLDDLNAPIAELLEDLNTRAFRKLDGCRRSVFEAIDRPALQPLPARRWELARWKKAKVNIDYHVEHDGRYYSVPHALVGEHVEVRVTSGVVEIFLGGRRVASHARLWSPRGSASTLDEHRPKSHREYGAWPPSRIIRWAATVGPTTAELVELMMTRRREPETAYRSCLGLIRDAKKYDPTRFEAACRRALDIGSPTRKTVLSILARGIESKPVVVEAAQEELPIVRHENVRGGSYFDRNETTEEPS
jgi:transposase